MSIDLSQFVSIFLEESYEGLDIMESGLLNFDSTDEETINTIFRAAHSIKGGAGTFGFNDIADFTHEVETLLDAMRNNKFSASAALVNLLLESVDCIKALIAATQDGPATDPKMINNVKVRLQKALESGAVDLVNVSDPVSASTTTLPDQSEDTVVAATDANIVVDTVAQSTIEAQDNLKDTHIDSELVKTVPTSLEDNQSIEELSTALTPIPASTASCNCWKIHFSANADVLQGGHEPMFLFEALAEFGVVKCQAVTKTIPCLSQLNPQDLYLSWVLDLESEATEQQLKQVFEWIEEESELSFSAYQKQPDAKVSLSDILDRSAEGFSPAAMQEQTVESSGWQINFAPHEGMLQTGNEPFLMLTALTELGDLNVAVSFNNLPELKELRPDNAYLSWKLTLLSNCSEEQILEVFEWVEDDCELLITPINTQKEERTNAVSEPEIETATVNTASVNASVIKGLVNSADHELTSSKNGLPGSEGCSQNEEILKEQPVTNQSNNTSVNKAVKAFESNSIRVDTEKVDSLINRVGELVITQAMLEQVGSDLAEITNGVSLERLQHGLELLERNTRDLQEDVMRVRMLPISFVFNRFPRLVHDVSGKLGKKVELIIRGEQTEIDKTVMEKIGDPIIHLIRNSLDHGLEAPDERIAAGKPETGKVELNAVHQGGNIIIDIIDDGRGLNTQKIFDKACEKGLISADQQLTSTEINELIFKPGFTTVEDVTDLSGRGVGMDVVRRNVESLGGMVGVKSQAGKGATFSIRLPLTLAILEGQLVRVHEETYIIPLVSIVETILADKRTINSIAGENRQLHFRDDYIPLISLQELFKFPGRAIIESPISDNNLIAIVESGGKKVGLIVDELFGQQQVVIKSLEVNFKRIIGFAGATILGDGSVALILDVAGLIHRAQVFEKN